MLRYLLNKERFSWALYDWANSAFWTTVVAGFFPIFFKSYWASELDGPSSSAVLGTTNSIAGFCIVLMAPILGTIADKAGAKKNFLVFFALLGIIATGSFFFIPSGYWITASILFGVSLLGGSGSNIFYDSLIVDVSDEKKRNIISGFGYGLGYLGGGILFVFNVLFYLYPAWFGFENEVQAILVSFLTVSIWWFIFTIPLFINVQEQKPSTKTDRLISSSFKELVNTISNISKYKNITIFLIAYWLYIDGVDTITRMSVAYGSDIGLEASTMITALIVVQFIAFPSAIIYGYLAERYGQFLFLAIGIVAYILITINSYFMETARDFYTLAVAIGLVQGGVQSVSRAIFSKMVPPDKVAEFFGFYNFVGKSAVVFGPALVGWVAYLTGDPRNGIFSLLALFIPGLIVLLLVPKSK
jgi:UMF1 family MFS transporter|nr:MAG: putative MFS-type transporter YxiO [Gammaproteobacteria bacterium]